MKLNVLTNSRPTKDLGEQLVVSSTLGQFKISPELAERLKVNEGERVAVGKDNETGNIYVFKGGDKVGAKIAKSGNYLNASSQNVWDVLEGDEDMNRTYVPVGEDIEDEDGLYVQIEFESEEPKQARKSSDDSEQEENEEDFSNEVEEENGDDSPEEL